MEPLNQHSGDQKNSCNTIAPSLNSRGNVTACSLPPTTHAGELTGEVLYNGKLREDKFIRRHIGYVEQFPSLLENFTVLENAMYTAELKQSKALPLARKKEKVECPCLDLNK